MAATTAPAGVPVDDTLTAPELGELTAALRESGPGPATAALLARLAGHACAASPSAAEAPAAAAAAPLLPDLASADLVDVVVAAERLVAWAQGLSLQAVAELDLRFDPPAPAGTAPDGEDRGSHPQAPTPVQRLASELACALRVTDGTAQLKVVLARRLHRHLPEVADALSDGRVDLPKARVIAEETAHLDDDTASEVLFRLLPAASGLTLGQLRNRLRTAALTADPEATRARRERNRRTGRDVRLTPDKDGLACLSAVLGEAEAAELFGQVQHAARTLVAADRAAGLPARPIAQARADAFVALFRGSASASAASASATGGSPAPGASGGGGGPMTRIGVLVPLEALLAGFTGPDDAEADRLGGAADPGGGHLPPPAWHLAGLDRPIAGEITGLGPVSGQEAAELALAAVEKSLRGLAGGRVGVQFIVVDHLGRAVAVTGTGYTVPPLLRAAVIARDRTCRFPGCTRPAVSCDLDHTRPFPEGSTELTNLAAACRRHHRLKTHGGWQVTQQPDGTLAWTSPLGQVRRTHPATYADPVDPPGDVPVDPAESWSDEEYHAWVERLCAQVEEVGLDLLPESTGPDLAAQPWAEELADWADRADGVSAAEEPPGPEQGPG